MKRFFSTILICILLLSLPLLASCGSDDQNTKLSVKDSLTENYDALLSQLKDTAEFAQLSDYLVSWAEKNHVDIKKKAAHYLVLSKPAAPNYQDADTVTLHASVSFDTPEELSNDLQCTAVTLATLYSADYHGPIRVLITEEKDGKPLGSESVESTYVNKENFLSLNYAEDPYLYNKIAGSASIMASHTVSLKRPEYTKAYKITFQGAPYQSPFSDGDLYPNAIKTIGDLLASCKSAGVLFELASFNGGDAADLTPQSVTAVIVLQENDVESFTTRFEKSYERMEEKYDEIDEELVYTALPVKMPARVVATADANSIISLLYTLIDGAYLQEDDEETYARTSIGQIALTNRSFKMNIDAKSLDQEHMTEIQTILQVTCGLSDVKYQNLSSTSPWIASKENPLFNVLSENTDVTPSGTLEDIDAAVFLKKKSDLNLAVYGTNQRDGVALIEAMINYMALLNQENQE